MEFNLRKLRPGVLTICLNSTGIGKVISERQLLRHRQRAGELISDDGKRIDLLKYSAWLASEYLWKRYKNSDEYGREQYRRDVKKRRTARKPIKVDLQIQPIAFEELNKFDDMHLDLPEIPESPAEE